MINDKIYQISDIDKTQLKDYYNIEIVSICIIHYFCYF